MKNTNAKTILCIDPSGERVNGRGITGVVIMEWVEGQRPTIKKAYELNNAGFTDNFAMFDAYGKHFGSYTTEDIDEVVIEKYVNNPALSKHFAHGENMTSQIVGIINAALAGNGLPIKEQTNTNIKQGNYPREGLFGYLNLNTYGYVEIINRKMHLEIDGDLKPINMSKPHCIDAMRHGLYYLLSEYNVDIYQMKKRLGN